MKRAAIYLRVSTSGQTTENQRRELEAVATQRGWKIVATYEDAGISGAKGRVKRPGVDQMLKDATAGRFDILASWSVDRLGRSLQDLIGLPLRAAQHRARPVSASASDRRQHAIGQGDVSDAR